MKREGFIITGAFLALLFGITIASFFSPIRERSESENRNLAKKPEFTIESLFSKDSEKRYTTLYENYITDQFVMRDAWIGLKTLAERLIGKTDINGVYFAKDGYLIAKTDPAKVDREQEEKNIARLTKFVQKYADKFGNDRVFCMLVPTAADVFKEKMPAFASDYDQAALLDRMKVLGKNLVDVRSILKEHSAEALYYRTDHHWTALGAYYAYRAWAEAAGFPVRELSDYKESVGSEEFYGTLYSKINVRMRPDTVMLYQDGKAYRVEYDMSKKYASGLFSMKRLEEKDKYMVYLDGNHALADIRGQNKNQRRLLVVKDSYAHTFVPFLAQDYEEVVMVDFRYSKMPLSSLMEKFEITDILVLYNVTNFIEDANLYQLEN